MEAVKGAVESKRRDGKGIKVEGEWYSVFSASDLSHVDWKDEVEFLYDQKGRYRNIKGKVTVVGKGGGASASGGASAPKRSVGYSNLGVELGHASNLAMRMMEQAKWSGDDVGTAEYFKEFVDYTEKVYRVMAALRGKYEGRPVAGIADDLPSTEEMEDLF